VARWVQPRQSSKSPGRPEWGWC